MQNIDVVSEFHIVADPTYDNSQELMNMRDGLTRVKNQPHYVLVFPEMEIISSFTKWMFALRSAKLVNGTFRAIHDESITDEAQQRPIFIGEILQNNTKEYGGTKIYEEATRVLSAKAGSKMLMFRYQTDAINFVAGNRIKIYAYDQVGDGNPPGVRYFEWNRIVEIDDLGVIYLKYPLQNNYSNDLWDNPTLSGGGAGLPRIVNLDREENVYPEYLEFENVTFGKSVHGKGGNMALPSDMLVMNRCKIEGFFWPSGNRVGIFRDMDLGPSEYDKSCGDIVVERSRFSRSANGGGSIDSITHRNCIFDESTRFDSRYVTIIDSHLRADSDPDNKVAALADHPAHCPIRRMKIGGLTLSAGAQFRGDAMINPAPFDSFIIQVSHEHIVIPFIDFVHPSANPVKMMEAGFTAVFRKDGQKGGMVSSIEFDHTIGPKGAFVIKGDWNQPPVMGEIWVWCHVREIIDLGGHRNLSDVFLWGKESIRWKLNQSTSLVKEMILTQKDFSWPGNITVDLYGYIVSVDLILSKPYKYAGAFMGFDQVPYVPMMSCNLKTGMLVNQTQPSQWVEKFTMNTFSIDGPKAEDALPEFQLLVRHRPFTF